MTLLGFLFLVVASAALLAVPRRWAPLPLLAGACYMTLGQALEIGPFNFTLIRMLLLFGFVRVVLRGERPSGGLVGMDKILLVWALWAFICPMFRKDPTATLINHLGMVYNVLGVYFLIRCFCQEWEDSVRLVQMTALVLVPVALEMAYEQLAGRNLFSIMGGVNEHPAFRNGRLRSQGPFSHAILAGTVGAVCTPLMIGIWRKHKVHAMIGLAACVLMVLASASSGPLMSMLLSLFGLMMWRWRAFTRHMRIAAVAGYILLDLIMKAPAYYVIGRIDLVGGSTGFHRAELIHQAVDHVNEWWLAGTDYTRHWMVVGTAWSDDHVDITNHYIAQGVRGGLPLMLLFMGLFWCGFRYVGTSLRENSEADVDDQFFIWSLGAALFAHATTCISVAYFDQSFLFLNANFAMLACLRASGRQAADSAAAEDDPSAMEPDPAFYRHERPSFEPGRQAARTL